MQPWAARVIEEANLFNPAFCATVLAKAADEFAKKANRPLPFALAFLILPIVLHHGTRSALPGSTVTSLLPWLVRAPFPAERRPDLRRPTQPSSRRAHEPGRLPGPRLRPGNASCRGAGKEHDRRRPREISG